MNSRVYQQLIFTFAAGSDTSDRQNLAGGAFGTLIVPAALAGSTLNLLAVIDAGPGLTSGEAAAVNGAALLSAAKTLVAGANPFTAAELAQIGAAGHVQLKLSAAPVAATKVVLWWKS